MGKNTPSEHHIFSPSYQNMSLRNVPSQNSFLYDGSWNAEVDSYLLSRLVEQRYKGNWNPIHVNYHAIMIAKSFLEEKFEEEYSWDEVHDRILKLKQRYDTFKLVVDSQGVWWDRIAGKVYAEQTVWREIVKKNPFALAYYHSHEPEMEKLTKMFGPTSELMAMKPVEVIEISDGSVREVSVRDHVSRTTILVSDEDDEVVSPILNRNKAKKKMLGDSSKPPGCYGNKRPSTYPPDFFVKPPKTVSSSKVKFPNVQAASSSCDSFSPKKLFHFPDKFN